MNQDFEKRLGLGDDFLEVVDQAMQVLGERAGRSVCIVGITKAKGM